MALIFEIKQNDRRPRYRVQLTADNEPVDLTGAVGVKFLMKVGTTGSPKVNSAASFVTQNAGIVEYAWNLGDTDTPGTYNVEFEIDWGSGQKQTFPSTGYFICTVNPELG